MRKLESEKRLFIPRNSLFLLLIFSFLFRFIKLGEIPQGVSLNEAKLGIYLSDISMGLSFDPLFLRLPFSILGVLSIYFIFRFFLTISRDFNLAFLISFIVSVSPWHIHESRIFSWGIVIVNLILLSLIFSAKFLIGHAKGLTILAGALSLILLTASVFKIPDGVETNVNYQRNLISKLTTYPFVKFFSNKYIESARAREKIFFEHLDFNNYFFSGFPRPRWGLEEIPKLYVVYLPLFILGLIKLATNRLLVTFSGTLIFLSILTFLGIRDSSLTFPLLIPISLLIASGFWFLKDTKKGWLMFLAVLVLVFEFIVFINEYANGRLESQFSPRRPVYEKVVADAINYSKDFDAVFVSQRLGDPEVFFKFYSRGGILGKFKFGEFDFRKGKTPNAVYIDILPYEASPTEPLFKNKGIWPTGVGVLGNFRDEKLKAEIIIFKIIS